MNFPSQWLDCEWLEGEDQTMLRYADAGKRIHIVPAPIAPYLFIHKEDLDKVGNVIENRSLWIEEGEFISVYGKKCVKLLARLPARSKDSVKKTRDDLDKLGVLTLESDVPFVRRMMIDNLIFQSPITERVYVDIEVKAIEGFPRPEEAKFPVISIAIVGGDDREWFLSTDDEVGMLREFHHILARNYHLVTGWNWRGFDQPYLLNRMKNLNMDMWKFFPIQEIDVMQNYRKLTIWGMMGKSYRLEEVAKQHLGVEHSSVKSKVHMDELWDSFLGDKKLLREYNVEDARIVKKLDELLKLCEPYFEIARDLPILIRDTPWMTQVWDHILLLRAQRPEPPSDRVSELWDSLPGPTEEGVRLVWPRKKYRKESLRGGYTPSPKAGVYRGLVAFDFKSLYPTVMETFQLSPETVFLYQAWKESGLGFNEWVGDIRNQ